MAGAVGAQLFVPPVSMINTMNFASQKGFQPVLADSVFKPSPTWWRMTRLGRKITGASMVWGVLTTEENSGGAYWGVQNLDTSIVDPAQPAELQWKAYYQNISIPWQDIALNSGPEQVIDLCKMKSEVAMGSLLQKLSRAIYGTSPNNTSLDLDSLPSAMAASGTYANITIGTSNQWVCNGGAAHAPGAVTGPSTATGAVTLATMQNEYSLATFGNEEPDTCITTQAVYNTFWGLVTANQRYLDDETTRAGFKMHMMFNNAVVLHDQFVPSGEMYMLTTKYTQPVFHQADYFKVWPFIMPTSQMVMSAKITLQMNLQLLSLRQHSRHTNLS